jgi:hypothetical protein
VPDVLQSSLPQMSALDARRTAQAQRVRLTRRTHVTSCNLSHSSADRPAELQPSGLSRRTALLATGAALQLLPFQAAGAEPTRKKSALPSKRSLYLPQVPQVSLGQDVRLSKVPPPIATIRGRRKVLC